MVDDIKNYVVEDLRIEIDGLEGEIRVLQLRQSYLEEILMLLIEPLPYDWDPEDRQEEVKHAL
jgi:hypothetical protein